MSHRPSIVGIVSGAIFAIGLSLSGMTDPGRVLGFLDLAGNWDPTLAFVMAGAVGSHFAWLRWVSRRAAPMPASAESLAPSGGLDARLIGGAAIFGVGWGMAGYCPGPALVASAFGRGEALLFTLAMLGGVALYGVFKHHAAASIAARDLRDVG